MFGSIPSMFFQFGGQGTTYLREMTYLYNNYPELKEYFSNIFAILDEGLAYLKPEPRHLRQGLKLKDWLSGSDVPGSDYLGVCTVALTCVHITQSAYYHLWMTRVREPELLLKHVVGMTGHSMGYHSAHLAALGLSGPDYWDALRRFVLFVLVGGYRCQETFPERPLSDAMLDLANQFDFQKPSSMASIAGLTQTKLQELLDQYNGQIAPERRIVIALVNTPQAMVVDGYEEELIQFRHRYRADFSAPDIKWNFLEVSAPFHSPLLEPAWEKFSQDQKFVDFFEQGHAARVPVISTSTGQNIQGMGDLYEFSFRLMTSVPLNWPRVVEALRVLQPCDEIIDFGPGRFSLSFTQKMLSGEDIACLSVTKKPELEILLDRNFDDGINLPKGLSPLTQDDQMRAF